MWPFGKKAKEEELTIVVAGGKSYTKGTQVPSGLSQDFTGECDGKMYVSGKNVPSGGHFDLQGYVDPSGKVHK
jgi:hypothetical protein